MLFSSGLRHIVVVERAHISRPPRNFAPDPAFTGRAVAFQVFQDFFDVQLFVGSSCRLSPIFSASQGGMLAKQALEDIFVLEDEGCCAVYMRAILLGQLEQDMPGAFAKQPAW